MQSPVPVATGCIISGMYYKCQRRLQDTAMNHLVQVSRYTSRDRYWQVNEGARREPPLFELHIGFLVAGGVFGFYWKKLEPAFAILREDDCVRPRYS
jgi:hypothetical protein